MLCSLSLSLSQEIYGIPPLLSRTLIEASEDSEETNDRRAKAIRRLEAVRGHLMGRIGDRKEMLGEAEKFLKDGGGGGW